MYMKKYLFAEILCILLTVCFIVYSVSSTSVVTDKSAIELGEILLDKMSTEDLSEKNINFINEKYDIDASVFSSVFCYASDDVMNVNEIFIGVFAETEDDSVLDKFNSYKDGRFNLYNGYAQEQSALIDSCVLEISSGVLIFCVDDNSNGIFSEFLEIV